MKAADRPKTVGILREDHLALMMQWREISDEKERAERAERLRLRVKEAGHDISDTVERDEAQGIIDYWASAISSLPGEAYPPIHSLDPYLGEAAKLAGNSARSEFEAMTSDEERRVARELFEDLLYSGSDRSIERGPPRARMVLQQRIRSQRLDDVLQRFVETGAIVRLAGDTSDTDRFEASDPHLVEDWPELRDWLREQGEYYERRSRLMSQAERWRDANRDPQQLAKGKEVETIDSFRHHTELLDKFIDASKRRSRQRNTVQTVVASLVIGVVALSGVSWFRNSAFADALLTEEFEFLPKFQFSARDVQDATRHNLAPPSSQGLAPAIGPETTGVVWLGSVDRPQIGTILGRPIGPDRAADEAAFRVLADVYMRQAMPSEAYEPGAEKAVIPAGTLVIVQGQPRSYDRPTGKQFWANVRVIPRVYIQYTNGSGREVQSLRAALADAGFDVPPAEEIDSARGLNEIRYFNTSDRDIGTHLVHSLRKSGLEAVRDVRCQSLANSRLKGQNFVLELWIDFDHEAAQHSGADC